MKKIRGRVKWVANKFQISPPHPRYVGVANFGHVHPTSDQWSIVVLPLMDLGENYCIAEIRFLAPNGPIEILKRGSKFDLREGMAVAATVEII